MQEMLFAAFEKHQYYNLKDLVTITQQPVVSANLFQQDFKIYLINWVEHRCVEFTFQLCKELLGNC